MKPEIKQMIDEFEQKVTECRNKGVNKDDSEFQKVVGTPPSAGKRANRLASVKRVSAATSQKKQPKKPPTKQKRKAAQRLSEDEESEDESDFLQKRPATERRSERPVREKKPIKAIVWSSDEDNDD